MIALMYLRALWLAVLFLLFGFHVRFGFDHQRVYLHVGKRRVVEPVSVVVCPDTYKVVSFNELETNDRQDAFMSAFIELNKFA